MVNVILDIKDIIDCYNDKVISAEECIHRIMDILGMVKP